MSLQKIQFFEVSVYSENRSVDYYEEICFLERRGNILYTRRFLTKTNRLPKWGEKFFANLKKYVPLIEESIVDPKTKTVTTYTRNVGLSRFMTATEKVQYKPDPNNPNETLAIKEIWIESGLYGLRSAVKNFGVERFKQNCTKATEGFNIVLEHWRYLRTVNHQNYLKTIPLRKWQEMMMKKDNIREKICAKRLTVEES